MLLRLIGLLLISSVCLADTPPPGTVKVKGGTDGTTIGNIGDNLKVTATFTPSGTQDVNVTNTSLPVTGTFFQATQPVSGTVTSNIGMTNGLALDNSLNTINTTLGSPFQAGGSIGNTSFGISGTLPAFASTPTFNLGTLNGAATAVNQTTANGSLSSIDTKLSQQGYGTQGSISNNASVTTTASTFTAPANAIGFILEAESGNTANIRWAIGSTATVSVGTLAEPGRDTGYIPAGANISAIAISGTQAVSVQWVVK